MMTTSNSSNTNTMNSSNKQDKDNVEGSITSATSLEISGGTDDSDVRYVANNNGIPTSRSNGTGGRDRQAVSPIQNDVYYDYEEVEETEEPYDEEEIIAVSPLRDRSSDEGLAAPLPPPPPFSSSAKISPASRSSRASLTDSLSRGSSHNRLAGIGVIPTAAHNSGNGTTSMARSAAGVSSTDDSHDYVDEDDSSSGFAGGHAGKHSERDTLARKESKMIYIWRLVVLVILVVVALIFSLKVYQHTREEELEDFRTQFYTYADQLVEKFYTQVESKYQALDILSLTIMSTIAATEGGSSGSNAGQAGGIPDNLSPLFTLPNFLPNFELHGSNTRILADALNVYYAPLVVDDAYEEEAAEAASTALKATSHFIGTSAADTAASPDVPTRSKWEFYTSLPTTQKQQLKCYENEVAYKREQDWLYGYNNTDSYYNGNPSTASYTPYIWMTDIDSATGEMASRSVDGSKQPYYLPIWQISPYTPDLINLDLLSSSSSNANDEEVHTYEMVLKTGHAQLSGILSARNATMDAAHDNGNVEAGDKGTTTDAIVDDYYFINNGQYRHENFQEFVVGGGDFRYDKSIQTFKLIQPEKQSPFSVFVYPVFDQLDAAGTSPKVTGVVASKIFWSLYFADILPAAAKGLMAVLENESADGTIVQQHSYYVYAHTVTYLGDGDQHEPQYDEIFVEADIDLDVFGVVASGVPSEHLRSSPRRRSYTSTAWINGNGYGGGKNGTSASKYRLKVYPTTDFKIEFTSRRPRHYAGAIWFLFLFTSAVFIIYDQLVEKRQLVVMDRAIKSTAVVSSLFPATVRDRLLNNAIVKAAGPSPAAVVSPTQPSSYTSRTAIDTPTSKSPGDGGNVDGGDHLPLSQRMFKVSSLLLTSPRKSVKKPVIANLIPLPGTGLRRRSSADNLQDAADRSFSDSMRGYNDESESGALTTVNTRDTIADRFPATTVMFADLAGFTSWSSNRQPDEVFALLETLYQAFDDIALRRKVFKVETIGDCYMAVCGLPEPQPDHAQRISKFAGDCMAKMKELVAVLEEELGEGTSKLSFRVGLNSGGVTAGVLRGEKSRFQLFGDTVNTAARMESTGIPGRIQCSESTAKELVSSGKKHWLSKRSERVQAKGKGQLQTYWVSCTPQLQQEITRSESGSGSTEATLGTIDEEQNSNSPASLNAKHLSPDSSLRLPSSLSSVMSSPAHHNNVTVMVADLVDFPEWSQRIRKTHPEQIFELLAALHQTLDEIAERFSSGSSGLRIMKVDGGVGSSTGNCYMAIAGITGSSGDVNAVDSASEQEEEEEEGITASPSASAAETMSLFAHACIQASNIASDNGEKGSTDGADADADDVNQGGDDNAQDFLSLRVGLHSGDVVIGELNSRIQIFGDTVTTATRMLNSCTKRGHIHCSQATAFQLVQANKSHWLSLAERRRGSSSSHRIDAAGNISSNKDLLPSPAASSSNVSVKTYYIDPTRLP